MNGFLVSDVGKVARRGLFTFWTSKRESGSMTKCDFLGSAKYSYKLTGQDIYQYVNSYS